jgi:hypothetical protein
MSRKSKTRKRAEQQSTGESRVLQMSLVEAAEILRENWGDILDPLAQVADDFGAGYRYSTVSQVGDRRRGENRPIFSTETELAVIRGSCRLIHDTYGTAQCALENLISFVLGKGLIVKTSSLPGAPSALASAVQVEIDRALAANKWQTVKEEEEYRRCVRDGETFLAIMPVDNTVRLRFIEPEQITEPAESTRIADWIGASSTPIPRPRTARAFSAITSSGQTPRRTGTTSPRLNLSTRNGTWIARSSGASRISTAFRTT